jgi:hypothetical protein
MQSNKLMVDQTLDKVGTARMAIAAGPVLDDDRLTPFCVALNAQRLQLGFGIARAGRHAFWEGAFKFGDIVRR